MQTEINTIKNVGYHQGWEDAYEASIFSSFTELSEAFGICEHEAYGHLNVPVWVHYETDLGVHGCAAVEVGILMPRHGRVSQYIAPATEEQVNEIRQRVLRVWAGRADTGFARYRF